MDFVISTFNAVVVADDLVVPALHGHERGDIARSLHTHYLDYVRVTVDFVIPPFDGISISNDNAISDSM